MAKKALGFLLVISLALGFAACAWSAEGDARAKALDSVKEPLKLINERMAAFEGALQAICEYTANPTDTGLSKAKRAVADAIADIALLPEAGLYLSENELTALAGIGIDGGQLRALFDYQAIDKNESIKILLQLSYFLRTAPEENEFLGYYVLYITDSHAANRKLAFLNLNKLFCGFSGSEIMGFRKRFLPSLSTFSADGLTWETDDEAIGESIAAALDALTEAVGAYAPFISERYMELAAIDENALDVLVDAGYEPAEAEEISAVIDGLRERISGAG